jgi:hypothetical protein
LKTEIKCNEDLETFAERYLVLKKSLEDREDDVKNFFTTNKNAPPKTVISMLSIVRIFQQNFGHNIFGHKIALALRIIQCLVKIAKQAVRIIPMP